MPGKMVKKPRKELVKKQLRLVDLEPRQQQFVLELMCDDGYNATEAARRAGYKNPASASATLMQHPSVQKVLKNLQRERNKRAAVTSDRILEEVDTLALRDPIDLCDENGMIVVSDLRLIPERMRRCIDGIKVKQWTDEDGNVTQQVEFRLSSKLEALKLSMMHRGMLTEKKQLAVTHEIDWDTHLGERGNDPNVIVVSPENMDRIVRANLESPTPKPYLLEGIPVPPKEASGYSASELLDQTEETE